MHFFQRTLSRLFTAQRHLSPPAAPKVERQDENSCDVTWEPLAPMKGDPILYNLQCMMGNSDFKQVPLLTPLETSSLLPAAAQQFMASLAGGR